MSYSPWGKIQDAAKIRSGFTNVSTAGHGGIRVSNKWASKLPEVALKKGIQYANYWWFEEDVAYAIPFFAFRLSDDQEKIDYVEGKLKDWYPDIYEALTGKKVEESESRVLRQRSFAEKTKDSMVAVSAKLAKSGDVEVYACRGGRGQDGNYRSELERFIVPVEEYDQRFKENEWGVFIIDENRHEKVNSFETW